MNCLEFKKIINEYVDCELSAEDKKAADEHLALCTECRKQVLLYKKLSEKVKGCNTYTLPEDFKVELPKKKNVVISFFRRHEMIVASLVAAAALVIFAGGINSDLYRAPVEPPAVEDTQKSGASDKDKVDAKVTSPISNENTVNETKKAPDSSKAAGETAPASENAPATVNSAEENAPKPNEVPAPASAVAEDTAEPVYRNEESASSYAFKPKMYAESHGISATYNETRDTVLGYTAPSADKFESEEKYNSFMVKLADIKARIEQCSEEEVAGIYAEFAELLTQIQ